MKTTYKAVLAAGILGAVTFASASEIDVVSAGTWSYTGVGTAYTQSESVLVSNTAPFATLNSMSLAADSGDVGTLGTVTYSNTAGTDTLTLQLVFTSSQSNGNGFSDSANWFYQSGTGSYAGLTGSGTYSNNTYNTSGGFSGSVLVGDLQAVPEPSAFAVLGIGALGLLVRRRAS